MSLIYGLCELKDIYTFNSADCYTYVLTSSRYETTVESYSVVRAPSSTINFWAQRLGIDSMIYYKDLAPFDNYGYVCFAEFVYEKKGYFEFYSYERYVYN